MGRLRRRLRHDGRQCHVPDHHDGARRALSLHRPAAGPFPRHCGDRAPRRSRALVRPRRHPHGERHGGDLDANGTRTDVDFGYTGTASVGDKSGSTATATASSTALNEPGIPGVPVTLLWEGFDGTLGTLDDISFPADTTDGAGLYLFEHLPGRRRAGVDDDDRLASLEPTFDFDGLATPNTAVRTIAPGATPRNVDFGYRGTLTIGDLVWFDVNGNGIGPDSVGPEIEPGIPGQQVDVRHEGADGILGNLDDILFTTTTGPDGRWKIGELPGGEIRVTLPDGDSIQPVNGMDVTSAPMGASASPSIAPSRPRRTRTSRSTGGLTGAGFIGDFVWLDVNGDNLASPGEPGLPNVRLIVEWAGWDGLFITNADNQTYETTTETVTDATRTAGTYGIDLLPPGGSGSGSTVRWSRIRCWRRCDRPSTSMAAVTRRSSPIWRRASAVPTPISRTSPTAPPATSCGGISMGRATRIRANRAFRCRRHAHLGGFRQHVRDGRRSHDGDADGCQRQLLVPGLPGGLFRVAIDQADLPAGLTATAFPPLGDGSGAPFTLLVTSDKRDLDFGYVGPYTIGDLVWRDTDRDGNRQTSERRAVGGAGITVTYLGPDGASGGGNDITFRVSTSAAAADQGARTRWCSPPSAATRCRVSPPIWLEAS